MRVAVQPLLHALPARAYYVANACIISALITVSAPACVMQIYMLVVKFLPSCCSLVLQPLHYETGIMYGSGSAFKRVPYDG